MHVSCLVLVSLWGRPAQLGRSLDSITQDLGTKGRGLVNGRGVPGVGIWLSLPATPYPQRLGCSSVGSGVMVVIGVCGILLPSHESTRALLAFCSLLPEKILPFLPTWLLNNPPSPSSPLRKDRHLLPPLPPLSSDFE